MRYASAKRKVYNNCLQMTIAPEPKTSSVILKILKILIQNQVKAGEYYIESCQGEDARHRVSTNMENPDNPENRDSKPGESRWILHSNLSGRRREASRLYEYG